MSVFMYSAQILLPSVVPGEEIIIIFLLSKVFVRAMASFTGLPSEPAEEGYLSTSSRKRILIGREARFAGEFAPTAVMCPPGNDL